jgi:ferredoxin-NADP reductase/MOSC domain-containing protein YiiM
MVYQMDSYRFWERELGRHDFSYGQFGENFTVEGLADSEVFIGDRFRIGSALFEISQPRVTCYRVGMRMNDSQMAMKLVARHRPGFYFRVLEEGEVGAGDEIVKIADGAERMSVAEVDAMLYLGARNREQLDRALRIPALSQGWQGSFQALLAEGTNGAPTTGNAGLVPQDGPPPAWRGFRQLRVSQKKRESANIISLELVAADDEPLVAGLPGQFIVLKIQPEGTGPSLLRNYSLSGPPATDRYRVSVKREEKGVASAYLHDRIQVGDLVDVAAPRGGFTLRSGNGPVVLISAGVGATPVLAMLHALAQETSPRQVWWLFGARNHDEHPFAAESRALIQALPRCKSFIAYSRPGVRDRAGVDFDATGHLEISVLGKLDIPLDANFYICGPAAFMQEWSAGIAALGIPTAQVHSELFGPGKAMTPGIADATTRQPHPPEGIAGSGPRVSFARSGLSVPWDAKYPSLLDFAEACDVPVRWSCRTGVCHNCESGLISGDVVYQPEPLEPPAAGSLLICCSRPDGEVVIDL